MSRHEGFIARSGASTSALVAEEIRKLQGSWKQIGYERDGVAEPLDEAGWEPWTTFVGCTFIVTRADGRLLIRGTYELDPSRNPKRIDWTDTFGEDAGKIFPAIYSLEGDRFIFCAAYEGQERPTGFRTGRGQVLRVSLRQRSAAPGGMPLPAPEQQTRP